MCERYHYFVNTPCILGGCAFCQSTPPTIGVVFAGISICTDCYPSVSPAQGNSRTFSGNANVSATATANFCEWRESLVGTINETNYSNVDCTGTEAYPTRSMNVLVQKVNNTTWRVRLRFVVTGLPSAWVLFDGTATVDSLDCGEEFVVSNTVTCNTSGGTKGVGFGGTATCTPLGIDKCPGGSEIYTSTDMSGFDTVIKLDDDICYIWSLDTEDNEDDGEVTVVDDYASCSACCSS